MEKAEGAEAVAKDAAETLQAAGSTEVLEQRRSYVYRCPPSHGLSSEAQTYFMDIGTGSMLKVARLFLIIVDRDQSQACI